MKTLLYAFSLIGLVSAYACTDANKREDSTIQREEEIQRENVDGTSVDKEFERSDGQEMEVDRDVLGDDGVELND